MKTQIDDVHIPVARILLVEDEKIIAQDLADTLGELGYAVVGSVTTGEDAVERAAELRPDLILMDIQLAARMDGIEAAELIRSNRKVAIVFLTAHSDDTTLVRAKTTEPLGYILKPFEAPELRCVIEIALHRYRSEVNVLEKEQLLAGMLRSIGDGVVSMGCMSKIRFLGMAEQILAESGGDEAVTRMVTDVLELINQETRPELQNPVHMAITALALAAEVSAQKAADQDARRLAALDPLTGLANYRRLVESLEFEIRRSVRTGHPFGVVLLDLNGLKKINDAYGHLVGSGALCRVASILRNHCREIDTAARYGGDEFVLVLPETGYEATRLVVERISQELSVDDREPVISVSSGIAVYPLDGRTIEELITVADRAMYRDKSGRERNLLSRTISPP